MVDKTVAEFGHIDVLINNAGTTAFIPMRDVVSVTEEVWDRTLSVNLKGPFLCSKAVAKRMLEQKSGIIINNASTAGLRPWGSSLPYCCSKAGLIMLTKCLAVALAPDIRVNAIAPGVVMTRWVAGFSEEVLDARAKATPLKRNASPEDVTQVVLFLTCDADYLTGEVIVVDGGWSM
jgi:3-oxoacyl-[acyl-carrier protein] reductase